MNLLNSWSYIDNINLFVSSTLIWTIMSRVNDNSFHGMWIWCIKEQTMADRSFEALMRNPSLQPAIHVFNMVSWIPSELFGITRCTFISISGSCHLIKVTVFCVCLLMLNDCCQSPCRVGSVGSVSASRTVGREFASRPGHTKDHHKNGTNCLPA